MEWIILRTFAAMELLLEVGKDVGRGHPPVYKWDFIECRQVRLYYKQTDHAGPGFLFYAMKWCSNLGGLSEEEVWQHPRTEVEIWVHGEARFDGLRHIWVGDSDRSGYIYYADSQSLAEVFTQLRVLEERFCTDIH